MDFLHNAFLALMTLINMHHFLLPVYICVLHLRGTLGSLHTKAHTLSFFNQEIVNNTSSHFCSHCVLQLVSHCHS